ncbi:hypothetical protein [Sporosarcina sp. NPDC096371]|uniref:hypothetical protein n=1 Tax=Sporosarcina sp. NPDC096371 TaxID=3364530 RepID=UPI0038090C20
MNTVMVSTSAGDHLQRYDAIRRKNAESAYNRSLQYNGRNQELVEKLEALLIGKDEPQLIQPEKRALPELNAGQMKKVVLPIGKTLEETIDLWRDVRATAISVPEPTIIDHQLVATASAKIMQVETQIALQKLAQSEFEVEMANEEIKTGKRVFYEIPPGFDREKFMMQKRFEQMISAYSFQVEAKRNGYEIGEPNFSKVM